MFIAKMIEMEETKGLSSTRHKCTRSTRNKSKRIQGRDDEADEAIGVRRGVSKGIEDSRRASALRAGHPLNGHKAIAGVARPQGVEG
jgi:hypothetical protein